jgi:hypothetical protein
LTPVPGTGLGGLIDYLGTRRRDIPPPLRIIRAGLERSASSQRPSGARRGTTVRTIVAINED